MQKVQIIAESVGSLRPSQYSLMISAEQDLTEARLSLMGCTWEAISRWPSPIAGSSIRIFRFLFGRRQNHPRGKMACVSWYWRADQVDAEATQAMIYRFAQEELGVPKNAFGNLGHASAALYGSTKKDYALEFELIRENTGGCH